MPDATSVAPSATPNVLTKPAFNFQRLAFGFAFFALFLGIALYAHRWWQQVRYVETTDNAYVGGNVTTITARIGGYIAKVPVQDNQHITAGDLLITLDARELQSVYDHAASLVDARIAALESLQARIRLQQAFTRQQQADLAGKTARAAFASDEAQRFTELAQRHIATRQELSRQVALDREGRAAVRSSAAGVDAAQEQIKVLEADTARAEAELAQARSELQAAELNLSYTEVHAPIDGFVGNRAAQVGSYVVPGAHMVSIIPDSGLWVDANFKESQLRNMAPGQPVSVQADILPTHTFKGQIASIAPGTGAVFSIIPPENATGNFTKIVQRVPVRISMEKDPLLRILRAGLSVSVKVDTRPASAVRSTTRRKVEP